MSAVNIVTAISVKLEDDEIYLPLDHAQQRSLRRHLNSVKRVVFRPCDADVDCAACQRYQVVYLSRNNVKYNCGIDKSFLDHPSKLMNDLQIKIANHLDERDERSCHGYDD